MATTRTAAKTAASTTTRKRLEVPVATTREAATALVNEDTINAESAAAQLRALDAAESPLVSVIVPKAFNYTADDHSLISYEAGIYDMPRAHAEHWYSKAMGVKTAKS
jgi:hypothetical protein